MKTAATNNFLPLNECAAACGISRNHFHNELRLKPWFPASQLIEGVRMWSASEVKAARTANIFPRQKKTPPARAPLPSPLPALRSDTIEPAVISEPDAQADAEPFDPIIVAVDVKPAWVKLWLGKLFTETNPRDLDEIGELLADALSCAFPPPAVWPATIHPSIAPLLAEVAWRTCLQWASQRFADRPNWWDCLPQPTSAAMAIMAPIVASARGIRPAKGARKR